MKILRKAKSSARSELTEALTRPLVWKTQFGISVLADTLPTLHAYLVPEYKSRSYTHLCAKVTDWSDHYGRQMWSLSDRRARNRLSNYLDPFELERVGARLRCGSTEASIRFGVAKKGHGYHGERGDFCLTSGVVSGRHLTLFYRSLELIGGLGYDLCIIAELGSRLNRQWKSVTIHAAHANVFALKGNSNEKLYPKLRRVLGL